MSGATQGIAFGVGAFVATYLPLQFVLTRWLVQRIRREAAQW